MKSLNLNIPKEIHKKFKLYCIEQGNTMTKVLIKMIEKEIGCNND